MISIPPRTLLAGPILRRCDRSAIHVWVAVSSAMTLEGVVFDPKTQAILGRGATATIAIGGSSTRLHVALLRIPAEKGLYPAETVLSYDLASGSSLFTWPSARNEPVGWSYKGFARPTFLLREKDPASVLHASCRKPHGHGLDALRYGDQTLSDFVRDPVRRPSALFLTGDQIYADDVAGALSPRIRALASSLGGVDEVVPWPGAERGRLISTIKAGERGPALKGLFTSGEAANHLVGFGEYAASYLLAWGAFAWSGFPLPEEAKQKDFRRVLPYATWGAHARRLLANVPTYMIFDDHDVTDDWNLTPGWTFRASLHPLTRRVIVNALAAFAAFQAWGNEPTPEWPDLLRRISHWVGSPARTAGAGVEEELLRRYWGYTTPAHPAALVLDTRSHRVAEGRRPDAPPVLLDPERLGWVAERLRELTSPLVVISPVPLVGVSAIDLLQNAVTGLLGKETVDFESWVASALGHYGFRLVLHQRASQRRSLDVKKPSLRETPLVVVLSGDVHYSACASEVLGAPGAGGAHAGSPSSRVLQFTSSAAKNAWLERGLTGLVRGAIAGASTVMGARRYSVYLRPSPAALEAGIRQLVRWNPPLDVVTRLEAVREVVEAGAPLVIEGAVAAEAPSFVQEVALLEDTNGELALTFESSIGWLYWNEDQLHMRMIEWDGKTEETADGAPRPKLSVRSVKVTRD